MSIITRLNPCKYFAGNNASAAIQYSKIVKHKPIYNYFIEARPDVTSLDMYNKYNELITDYNNAKRDGDVKPHMEYPRVAIKCSSFGFHKEYIDITVKSFLQKGWQVIIDAEIAEEEKVEADRLAYENSSEGKAKYARLDRDYLLREVDWSAGSDVTMSDAMKAYRQALRDVPQQAGFPDTIEWPVKP